MKMNINKHELNLCFFLSVKIHATAPGPTAAWDLQQLFMKHVLKAEAHGHFMF